MFISDLCIVKSWRPMTAHFVQWFKDLPQLVQCEINRELLYREDACSWSSLKAHLLLKHWRYVLSYITNSPELRQLIKWLYPIIKTKFFPSNYPQNVSFCLVAISLHGCRMAPESRHPVQRCRRLMDSGHLFPGVSESRKHFQEAPKFLFSATKSHGNY